jgi:hypothetical protein
MARHCFQVLDLSWVPLFPHFAIPEAGLGSMTFASRGGPFPLIGVIVKGVQEVFLLLGHLPSTEEGESPSQQVFYVGFHVQQRTIPEALLRA